MSRREVRALLCDIFGIHMGQAYTDPRPMGTPKMISTRP